MKIADTIEAVLKAKSHSSVLSIAPNQTIYEAIQMLAQFDVGARPKSRGPADRSSSAGWRPIPTKRRKTGDSYSASSAAGSDSENHCCRKYTRNMIARPTGLRPVSPFE
jgi:hypothetical protein